MKATDIILVDTAFWIAWLDPRDQHHHEALAKENWLTDAQIMVPWPIVYETVRTRLVRRPEKLLQLDRVLKRPQVNLVDDSDFRADAYDLTVEYAAHRKRSISMVDMLCRLLIEDVNTRIDAMLTTNPEDFRDVCQRRGVIIL
jgi:predicted nucleic acid-binding protein